MEAEEFYKLKNTPLQVRERMSQITIFANQPFLAY